MRRILGAAILVAVIVLPRADELIQFVRSCGDSGPAQPRTGRGTETQITRTAPPDTRSSTPNAAASVPRAYIENPLAFLSRAPVDSLALLPGIGPVIAERIANARTGQRSFTRWEELLDIKGIGPKKLDRLRRIVGSADRP